MNKFNSEEHFYLALDSVAKSNYTFAIWHIKSIKEGAFYDKSQYLLATVYAELGIYNEAKKQFSLALEFPEFKEIAGFQLGLLHLTLGEFESAKLSFHSLVGVKGDKSYIDFFSRGILELLDGNHEVGEDLVQQGILHNKINIPLNNDISKFLESYLSSQEPAKGETELIESEPKSLGSEDNQFLLTNYKNRAL